MTTLLNPYFGEFGGMYVPQILMPALRQLEEAFVSAQKDPEFQACIDQKYVSTHEYYSLKQRNA